MLALSPDGKTICCSAYPAGSFLVVGHYYYRIETDEFTNSGLSSASRVFALGNDDAIYFSYGYPAMLGRYLGGSTEGLADVHDLLQTRISFDETQSTFAAIAYTYDRLYLVDNVGNRTDLGIPDGYDEIEMSYNGDGMSRNGKYITGWVHNPANDTYDAFVWSQADGFVILQKPEGYAHAFAYNVSNDGMVISGDVDTAVWDYRACIWSRSQAASVATPQASSGLRVRIGR